MKAQKFLFVLAAVLLAGAGSAWAGGRVYGSVGVYVGPGAYWGPAYQAFLEEVKASAIDGGKRWMELSPVELVKGLLIAGVGVSQGARPEDNGRDAGHILIQPGICGAGQRRDAAGKSLTLHGGAQRLH